MNTKILKSVNSLSRLIKVEQKKARLLVSSGADPWVIFHNGWYYYCRVVDDWKIAVNKSKRLQDIGKVNHFVWKHPLNSPEAEVWAPELHYVSGKWYIYFTMGKAEQHRMYVLQAKSDDPQGEYELKGKISDPTDKWSIDGTVLELHEKLYFVWSGWEGDEDGQQNLYIAQMSNPWTLKSKRVCISTPEYGWEKASRRGLCDVNEGPQILKRDGKIFIIYSASHSLTNDYCLGQLSLVGDDPLQKNAWEKSPLPVFCKNDRAFGPGHASFIKKLDGSDWIVYHTARYSNAGWDRQVLAQKFNWLEDGSPNFAHPLPLKSRFAASRQRLQKVKVLAGLNYV